MPRKTIFDSYILLGTVPSFEIQADIFMSLESI